MSETPANLVDRISSEVSGKLGIDSKTITFVNADLFDSDDKPRYLYGFTKGSTEMAAGFIKVAGGQEEKRLLQRESQITVFVSGLGIEAVGVLRPYTETESGYGVLELAKLSLEQGDFLADDNLIAVADKHLGARAARSLASASGRPLGIEVAKTQFLERSEERVISGKTFREVWARETTVILDPKYDFVDQTVGREKLREIIERTQADLFPLVDADDGGQNGEFFYHGDAHPRNMFFPADKQGTIHAVHYAMEQIHPRHQKAVSLLTSLERNLEDLDSDYKMFSSPPRS